MKPEDSEDWLDRVAARRASPEERREWLAELADRPAEQRRLSRELALNDLLEGHRPAPKVSSNFTARVLAEVTRPAAVRPRSRSWLAGWILSWRAAAAAGFAGFLLVAGWALNLRQQREYARELADWGRAAAAMEVRAETLAEFEVVRDLGAGPRPDDDALILALAQ
jgi:anti-sigma factor RsiW